MESDLQNEMLEGNAPLDGPLFELDGPALKQIAEFVETFASY